MQENRLANRKEILHQMPSLRIDQSDLKCKNGCDYFGNPQWQGYCSKCHREQLLRQRRAEKASSATLPKPEQKKPERAIKLASQSFSKFEEKRLRQSETLKKAFSVFKKSSTDDQEHTPERKPPEFKIPGVINEGMKREFRVRFSTLPQPVDRDARVFVHNFITDVIKCANDMTVDELSERVQRHYQHFINYMDTSPHLTNVESETKELLIDFVEKHAMTYLHGLPGVVFSPSGTEDERLDRAMSERIQQLSWVGKRHLECKLDRANIASCQPLYKAISGECQCDMSERIQQLSWVGKRHLECKLDRANIASCQPLYKAISGECQCDMSERIQQLSWVGKRHLECKLDRANIASCQPLYKAISELLAMDGAPSPGGKLTRVRRACRHVLALCGAPASADDLLPALIFTVLKANPPRLVSNINFVTRFCNAQRLMTGEGGYYFTNLCCAVSFIENLTAESLNMDKREFDCYMAMPASIGGSTWAAALSLCGAVREAEEQTQQARKLMVEVKNLRVKARQLSFNAETFEKEIAKKVQDVLAKAPLKVQRRRILPSFRAVREAGLPIIKVEPEPTIPNLKDALQVNLETKDANLVSQILDTQTNTVPQTQILDLPQTEITEQTKVPEVKISEIDRKNVVPPSKPLEEPLIVAIGLNDDKSFHKVEKKSPKSPQKLPWELKHSGSYEVLSPLCFAPFDTRSIDELITPDDLAPGLSNINYDIDLSDFSGDNSLADDPPKPKDPFSPDGIKKDPIFDPFSPQTSQNLTQLEKFDEFSLVNTRTNDTLEAFEVIHRKFEALGQSDPFGSDQKEEKSILDDSGSPTSASLLPSPLLPQTSKQ
ncbi:rab5 GDP/GTP exchange factor isoform X2 [Bicyclus anynana]|uniref:Rab5 GDP/GTP exchange factor isoform X2 n=1 Tax=Bicyclus anynana TaxID=110368 RepID=A0ABM3LFG5_BICAN|nr:rab5 GDP/GTP exchange factor isoform X2 [Bicyclus anynana]